MSIIDDVLRANREYARNFQLRDLPMPPARHVAILACMDARLSLEPMLGLKTGDAHIIRNAGGVATDDAVRSLIISYQLLGTREFMVINHTDCGMLTFRDEELERDLVESTGKMAVAPARFFAFSDIEQNVRDQINKLRSHPWIPSEIAIRGFVYDVKSGALNEVQAPESIQKVA